MIIYKYDIEALEKQTVEIPYVHKILKVGIQDGGIKMWVAFHLEESPAICHLYVCVVATGQEFMPPDIKYFDTVFLDGLVWHIYIEDKWAA